MKKAKPAQTSAIGKTTRASEKFVLRLPDGMREALAVKAAANGRSMNTEAIAALNAHLSGETEQESLKRSWNKIGEAVNDLEAAQRSLQATMIAFERLAEGRQSK